MTRKFALSLFSALAIALAAPAQSSFQVTPDGLTAGMSAQISYSAAALANSTILVEIDDGGILNPQFQYVTIALDANGNGSGSWHVPENGWKQANFSAPGGKAVGLKIYRPTPVVE